MSEKRVINELTGELNKLASDGHVAVPIKNLQRYLEAMSEEAEYDEGAVLRQFEADMESFRTKREVCLKMFDSVIESGARAVRAALLINGGSAAIALLAFMGDFVRNDGSQNGILSDIGYSLLIFVFGTGLAGLVAGATYITQFF